MPSHQGTCLLLPDSALITLFFTIIGLKSVDPCTFTGREHTVVPFHRGGNCMREGYVVRPESTRR